MSLPKEVRRLAEGVLGTPVAVRADLSRPGSQATVLRLAGPVGPAVAKLQRNPDKHARERDAYLRWLPAHGGAAAALLAVRDQEPRALLMRNLPGRAGPSPDAAGAERVHRAAGAWLARLHALPFLDGDPVAPAEAYARRARAWFARAEGAVPDAQLRDARRRVADALPALRGAGRVPCHRDFGPHNWLTRGDTLTGVIDFEHARPDLAAADLLRPLAYYDDLGRGDLRSAFLNGYRDLTGAAAPAVPEGLRLLEAVGTLAWAHRHAHRDGPRAARDAARALERLLSDAPRRGDG